MNTPCIDAWLASSFEREPRLYVVKSGNIHLGTYPILAIDHISRETETFTMHRSPKKALQSQGPWQLGPWCLDAQVISPWETWKKSFLGLCSMAATPQKLQHASSLPCSASHLGSDSCIVITFFFLCPISSAFPSGLGLICYWIMLDKLSS